MDGLLPSFLHQKLLQRRGPQPSSEAGAAGSPGRKPGRGGGWGAGWAWESPALFKLCTPMRQMMTI